MKTPLALAALLALAFPAPAPAQSIFAPRGEKVYETTCIVCHDAGLSGAPKLGDRRAWAPRLAAGKPTLVDSVLKGKGLMPPKGSNPRFTEEDIKAAVDFMVAAVK